MRRSVKLVVPPDCEASVILKQVAHDDKHRYYMMWLLVGRYDREAISVSYRFTGEDTIRCDIPNMQLISASELQSRFVEFWQDEPDLDDKPPIIWGKL